eukprot:1943056-Prymnesium_polylepis.1
MSGSPEARVAPEASGIGESSRSRSSRSTRPRPIHCQLSQVYEQCVNVQTQALAPCPRSRSTSCRPTDREPC